MAAAPVRAEFEMRSARAGVGDARDEVVRTVRSWGAGVDLDALRLSTSEMLTNALRHGSCPIRVSIEWGGRRLRVEVEDQHPVRPLRPLRHERVPLDSGGRGLHVVSELADRWGTIVVGGTKRVWFELPASVPPCGPELDSN